MTNVLTRRGVMVGAAAIAAVLTPQELFAAAPAVHTVEIKTFKFAPSVIRVRIGDTIRWANKDLAPHTATADELGWDTGALERNETAETLVTAGMETSYFCAFHPQMKGRIEIIG